MMAAGVSLHSGWREDTVMDSTSLAPEQTHALALLLSGRCRGCAERIPGGTALRGRPCPRCGEETLPSPSDRAVLHGLHTSRSALHLGVVVGLVSVASMAASWFPLANSILLAVAFDWMRFKLLRPAMRLLTPQRGLVSRLTLRLAGGCILAASVALLELLTFIPAVGPLLKLALSAVQITLSGLFIRRYLSWQLQRESQGLPVAPWEVVLLAGWGALLLALIAAVAAVVLWLATARGWLGALPGATP
jgi:hypothetical protein